MAIAGNEMIGLREIEGRGRAMVASKPLKAGQIVLRDSPIIIYSALPFHQLGVINHFYCTHCFRTLSTTTSTPSVVVSCPSSSHYFCSSTCQTLAFSTSHTPWACEALNRIHTQMLLPNHQNQDLLHIQQASFLISAYNLSSVSPLAFRTLLSLQGQSAGGDEAPILYLHSLLSSLPPVPPPGFPFSLELTATLLAKDRLNAFGLMEPSLGGERSVRAYGIYPVASFFNHDCLPNACRFDYLDNGGSSSTTNSTSDTKQHGNNTDIIIRMIHDVPQGREICLSYFPVNLKYAERQRRLKDDYGFTCNCDRCKVEANWSESEEDQDQDIDNDDVDEMVGDNDDNGQPWESENATDMDMTTVSDEDDFPHAYFFLRYMCDRNNCWGTLAPLPPSEDSTPSNRLECNVCGFLKNDLSLSS